MARWWNGTWPNCVASSRNSDWIGGIAVDPLRKVESDQGTHAPTPVMFGALAEHIRPPRSPQRKLTPSTRASKAAPQAGAVPQRISESFSRRSVRIQRRDSLTMKQLSYIAL